MAVQTLHFPNVHTDRLDPKHAGNMEKGRKWRFGGKLDWLLGVPRWH